MLHEQYEDMDPDYSSRNYLNNKKPLDTLDGTLMKKSGLYAQNILSANQLGKVHQIRLRRLANVIGGFLEE